MNTDVQFTESNCGFALSFGESSQSFCTEYSGSGSAGQGKDGASAYEIALKNGFVGSEVEWLESLHGKDGYTPVKGVDYFDGAPGKDGKDGDSGVYVGSGDLPEASETLRGSFAIVPNGDTDNLYICMRVAGVYGWVVLNASGTSDGGAEEDITTTSVLGRATLGTMILGG